jgi:hypothetical protein
MTAPDTIIDKNINIIYNIIGVYIRPFIIIGVFFRIVR